MQAIHNTTANTITLKPAAPVDAPTFARLKNAGFAWRADSGAFVASPAGELARGVAADIAGQIETRDAPAEHTKGESAHELVNSYEARQAARRERYAALADKMRTASAMHYSASRRAVEHIPFGQPILVGHHSERGHRATLARAHRAMDRSCEAASKAEHYAQRAESVGSGGISSDDPAALVKLRAEHAQAEQLQKTMKDTNKVIRAHKTPEARAAALVALGMSDSQAAALLKPDFMGRIGFPDYRLKNNGANIRRIAGRIAELETRRQAEDVEHVGRGYTYREDVDENRVMFEFPGKPAAAVRDILKNSGFRWSPSRGAWVRQLNNAGRWNAQDAARRIDALDTPDDDGTATDAGEVMASGEAETVQASSEQKPSSPSGEAAADTEGTADAETATAAGKPADGETTAVLRARAHELAQALQWTEAADHYERAAASYPSRFVFPGSLGAFDVEKLKARASACRAQEAIEAASQVQASGEDPQAAPSGEQKSEQASGEAAAPLVAGRWIPHGAENAERIAVDAAIGAEVWLIASTRQPGLCAVIAYAGKRTKHDGHYTMRDRAQALQWAAEYLGKRQASAQRQAEQRAEKAAKRAAGHKLQVGDVLRSSWGYDQTNIDYYEVTRLVGKRMVEIRKIGAESAGDGYMTGDCVPRPGHYTGEPMRKMVSDYDGKSVRIASYASANKIEPRDVGGVKVWPVDHWTAYA